MENVKLTESVKLCIFGTRSFYDHPEASKLLDEQIAEIKPDMILTAGDADGVCRLAIEKARKFSIPCELHFLNRTKYARGMFYHRSLDILKKSNFVLFIHNGKSQGTKNEIEMTQKLGIEYRYFQIEDDPIADLKEFEPEDFSPLTVEDF